MINLKWIGILSFFIFTIGMLSACGTQSNKETEIIEVASTNEHITTEEKIYSEDVNLITGDFAGDFVTTNIEGKVYTDDVFADNELTVMNVFTTWCTYCIEELPALETLNYEMAEKGVRVIGLVYDCRDEKSGTINDEAIEKAGLIQERGNITFTFLIPDETFFHERFKNELTGFPTTYFVDKNGNMVGEIDEGFHNENEWRQIINSRLEMVSGAELGE